MNSTREMKQGLDIASGTYGKGKQKIIRKVSDIIPAKIFKRMNGDAQAKFLRLREIYGDGKEDETYYKQVANYIESETVDHWDEILDFEPEEQTLTLDLENLLGNAGTIINNLWPVFIIPVVIALFIGYMSKLATIIRSLFYK